MAPGEHKWLFKTSGPLIISSTSPLVLGILLELICPFSPIIATLHDDDDDDDDDDDAAASYVTRCVGFIYIQSLKYKASRSSDRISSHRSSHVTA